VEARLVLALALGRLGDLEKARPHYENAVAWLAQHPSQETVLRRLRTEVEELLGPAPAPRASPPRKEP
jgi:hypothetical protein